MLPMTSKYNYIIPMTSKCNYIISVDENEQKKKRMVL